MKPRLQTRFTGIAAGVLLVILLVGLPALLIGTYPLRVPAIESWDEFLAFLGRPDDGTLALLAIWGNGWVVWAILAGLICTELIAAVRGVQAPRWPGLGRPQHAVRALVAAAVLALLPATALDALVAPPAMAQTPDPPADDAPSRTAKTTTSNTTEYVVKRGDSLWRIAERHLGDGERYPEIVALNSRLLHRGPDFLRVGWTLRLPTISNDSASAGYDTYIVKRGDTLSDIARDHLGSPHKWQTIANASRHITQPDGRRLTDPNQIDIGWILHIPRPTTHPAPVESESDPPSTTPLDGDNSPPVTTPQPSSTPSQQSTESQQRPYEEPTQPADELNEPTQSDDATPAWMLAGLTGAGALLAGSLWFALQRKRRLQIRHRRPGRAIHVPPPELAPVERTARAVATAGAGDHIRHLDATLKTLARQQTAAGRSMPRLSAIQLASEGIRLHLAPPFVALPPPWQGADDRWSVSAHDLSDHDPAMADQAAPYPLLVTLGEDDQGDAWLLNLEQAGVVDVHGAEDYVDDFARHLIAEIAVNPWSEDVRATCVGLGEELVALDPVRIHHSAGPLPDRTVETAAMAERLAAEDCPDVPTARAREAGHDLWDSRVLFLSRERSQGVEPVLALVQSQTLRTGTAIVLMNQRGQIPTAEGGVTLHLSHVGRLKCDALDLDLLPGGLTSDEARGCAALLSNADDLRDTSMPVNLDARESWRPYADQAGALRDEFTRPRSRQADGHSDTLLPLADTAYLDVAATTVEDLHRLAPQAIQEAHRDVAAADPSLDDDLASWAELVSTRPKLTLLGPLSAECGAAGKPEAVHARKAYYTELLVYLATRVNGATTEQVAEAMGILPGRVRKDVAVVREWLGVNPATGTAFIPDARRTKAAQASGIPTYEVEGVLVDADLFRRLRLRGQAAGASGIVDFQRALSLVSGEPLSRLRRGGGNWLIDGDRLDQILSFAIVDVAHVVATALMESGDLAEARSAAEVAIAAAPFEETPRLDYAAAGGPDLGQPSDELGRPAFPVQDDDPARTRHISGRGRK